jgi:tetratricopeptide (TPR) repeat protein
MYHAPVDPICWSTFRGPRASRLLVSLVLGLSAAFLHVGCAATTFDPAFDQRLQANPRAERDRLEKDLNTHFYPPEKQYVLGVELADAEAVCSPTRIPAEGDYARRVRLFPNRPEAKLHYARYFVVANDRLGQDGFCLTPFNLLEPIRWMDEVIAADVAPSGEHYLLRSQLERIGRGTSNSAARADLAKAAALGPVSPQLLIEQARREVEDRRFSAADAHLRSALALPDATAFDRGMVHALLGRAAQRQFQSDTAVREYALAIQEDPGNVDGHYGRAMYCWAKQDQAGYAAEVKTVRELNISHPLICFDTGMQLWQRQVFSGDQAVRYLQIAAQRDPENPTFTVMLRQVTTQRANTARAINDGVAAFLGTAVAVAIAADMDAPHLQSYVCQHTGGDHFDLTLVCDHGHGKVSLQFIDGRQEWWRIARVGCDGNPAVYHFDLELTDFNGDPNDLTLRWLRLDAARDAYPDKAPGAEELSQRR